MRAGALVGRLRRPAVFLAGLGIVLAACGGGDGDVVSEPASSAPTSAPTTVGGATATTAATPLPKQENLTLPAPSLDGNLVGDPSEVRVVVQTPASYGTDTTRRYPVVYFLAGYDEAASVGPISAELQQLVAAGKAPEMILVGVSGKNALGGSFYTDSPVTGKWATAVTQDVVGAIDTSYRTLATPASRGIGGFSMGGYGALALAMQHPDVFGAVYALSPGLFAPGGLAESQMFADPAVPADILTGRSELATLNETDARAALKRAMGRSGDERFSAAYGMAFAPDPTGPPPWFQYPVSTPGGTPDPAIWARWEDGFGGIAAHVEDARAALTSLRGIALDVGTNDEYAWIPPGVAYLHERLDAAGIPHRYEQYDGGHGPVGPRAREVMLPFFADVLAAS